MPNITNHSKGNLNDIRNYPFVDNVDLQTASGNTMPPYILNDIHVWWPDTYGTVGFISSATVSPSLVTMTIATENTDTNVVTIIASVQVTRPHVPYKSVAVTPIQDGVGGWIAVGAIPNNNMQIRSWLFNDSSHSTLLPRVAQAYPIYPVTSLSEVNSPNVLQGNVRFRAGSNITINEGYRYVEGDYKRCIVFSLDEDKLPSLYEFFSGPCGNRPESENCDRVAIRRINGVVPDCNGRLFVEVDNTNSVIDGSLDITDEATGTGLVLTTPIEYGDICAPLSNFPVLYDDECASLSAIAESSSTSSGGGGGPGGDEGMSSSSFAGSSVYYTFEDINELNDWSLFEGEREHVQDWDMTQEASQDENIGMRLIDNRLLLRYPATTSYQNTLVNNRIGARIENIGDFAEIEVNFRFKNSEINEQFAIGASLFKYFEIGIIDDVILAPTNFIGHAGFLVSGEYNRTSTEINLDANLAKITPALIITSDVVDEVIDYSSSSELSSSSLSGDATYLTQRFKLRIEAEGSLTDYRVIVEINDQTALNTVISGMAGLANNNLFFTLNAPHHDSTSVVNLDFNTYIDNVYISAQNLVYQECDEEDVNDAGSLRTPYSLKYEPDNGFSNDFGTSRAKNQFTIYQPSSLIAPQGFNLDSNNRITRAAAYMSATGNGHKYATFNCDNSVVSDPGSPSGYVFSAAFKYVSGDPKVGLLLGYQDGDDRDLFWSVVVDLNSKRFTYGFHYKVGTSSHIFVPVGWNSITGTTSNWPFEWHRILMRVTFSGGQYGISMWLDHTHYGSSSSAFGLSKTIAINYASPTYTIIRDAWAGDLGLGHLQFGDGRPGVYVYGGAARIAEFTVSPVGENVTIPNKVPWLTV